MGERPSISRRRMLGSTLAAAGGAWAMADLAGAPAAADMQKLAEGSVVLFQGDSITDANRDRRNLRPNSSAAFGRGYAYLIGAHLLGSRVGDSLRCYNRGISGDRVPDLQARWQTDTLDLKPDLLSILIGVNDIWHKINGRSGAGVEDFEKGYSRLLAKTREALPRTRIAICEPFVLRCGVVNGKWFPEFDQRRAAARRVAAGIGATWVPFQTMFDRAVEQEKPAYWAEDGVHPSMAGHALMAKTWIDAVNP